MIRAVKAPEGDYITAADQLRLLPGAAEAIARLNAGGALVIVVSNQRGIALGRMSAADVDSATTYPIASLTASKNAVLAQAFVSYVLSPAGQAELTKVGFQAP